jgi:hypothetical protein
VSPLFSQTGTSSHQHEGFFGRLILGTGTGKTVIEDVEGSDMEFKGSPFGARIQLGGSISKNLILFGEFGVISISEPDVTWMNEEAALTGTDLSVNDYGLGLSYYLMPSNIFISGSLNISKNTIEINNTDDEDATTGETDSGLGFYLSVGKEWWVGDKWAIGGAIFTQISNTKDSGPDENPISNQYFGIAFTVTYD